ncbi:MAG TPA: hypothetical protein VK438_04775 [Xanthobacteraceae bacterium]|nr:hypothetical protein [Xanthobacteraceae bacterium]
MNIKHYRALLASETDQEKRRTIAKLLAEEEAKLATHEATQRKQGGPTGSI